MKYLLASILTTLVTLTFKFVFFLVKIPFLILKKPSKIQAKLIKIKDGDTFSFELLNGERINLRLFGIDTPEKFSSEKMNRDLRNQNGFFQRMIGKGVTKEEMVSVGEKSTEFAKTLLQESETYMISVLEQDKYGRYVGIVYFNEDEKSKVTSNNYNLEMIKQGYAKVYPNYIKNDFIRIQYIYHNFKSRMSNKGLWKTNRSIMINL